MTSRKTASQSHTRRTTSRSYGRSRDALCPSLWVTLLCALALSFPSPVSAQVLQASYPLLTDLADTTGTYADVSLIGSPPPAPPANGVCGNGIYEPSPGGQDIRTPPITSLNTNDFQVDVDFNLSALQARANPVVMAGPLWRWIGVYIETDGRVGAKYNNFGLV